MNEVVGRWVASVRSSVAPGEEVPKPHYALVFVPSAWAADLDKIVAALIKRLHWPKFAPMLGVVSEAPMLILHTSFMVGEILPDMPAPRVFFLGKSGLDQVSRLAVDPELRSTNTMKINGTVLAVHAYLQREPQQVGSLLLFGDISHGTRLVNRALAALDVAYPSATKAGLVVPRASNAPSLAVGFRGQVVCKEGGVLGLALPAPMHTAIGLCGCRPVGLPLEVHDADLEQGAFIRTVGSAVWETDSWGVPGVVASNESSRPPRRQSVPTVVALRSAAKEAGFERAGLDFWVGVPRGSRRDEALFRVAPGAGEWALYQCGIATAEGTMVLDGEGPGADGLGKKGLSRIQAFISEPNYSAVGNLDMAYQLERMARLPGGSPAGTLLLAGGPGAAASIADKALYGGCAVGLAVIGHAGLVMEQAGVDGTGTFSYSAAGLRSTAIHRQAAGLLYLRR